jgi:hypothetical protein
MEHTTHFDGCDCVMNEMKRLREEKAVLKIGLNYAIQALEYIRFHEQQPPGEREYHNKIATEALEKLKRHV